MQWDIRPEFFIESIEGDVKNLIVDTANKIFDGVVSRSPVHSGRFRASWYIGESLTYIDVGTGGLSLPSPGKLGQSIPAASRPGFSPTNNYPTIYITNGTPYASLIEYGWSKQAPQGVVRVTLETI